MDTQIFSTKFSGLPEKIKEFQYTEKPMVEMKKAFVIFGVNSELSRNIAQETGQLIVGDLALEQLPQIISQKIQVTPPIAFGIAYEMAKRLFYPFSDYYKNVGLLLEQWKKQSAAPLIMDDIKAHDKVLELEPWIKEMELEKRNDEMEMESEIEDQTKKESVNHGKIILKEALRNLSNLENQLVTGEKIKLHNSTEPVRPSIKNWLSDYTFNLGFNPHDAMERGNFLFQNENAKKLSAFDRQKLSLLLRAYDENLPVNIDLAAKEIIFPVQNIESSPTGRLKIASQINPTNSWKNTVVSKSAPLGSGVKMAPFISKPAQSENSGKTATKINPFVPNRTKLSFSSPQKLPNEKPSYSPSRIVPFSKTISSQNYPAPSNPSTLGKNVINLKDFQ